MHTTLISAQQLHHERQSIVVLDCRFDLAKPDAGRVAYLAGHIPGAIYADLEGDLSGPKAPRLGRHPLPDPALLASTFGQWGISSTTQVVAYDADSGMYAARAWWLLRWLGHRAVAVLNGGFKAWVGTGFPVSAATPHPKATVFEPHLDESAVATTDDVESLVQRGDWRVLDARAPERFRGEVEPIDPVAGHIPGARNHPFAQNLGSDGRFFPAAELRKKFAQSLDGVDADHAIVMCGSGVTACHNLLALEVAGLYGAKLYAGSWSEWIRDRFRPVAKG